MDIGGALYLHGFCSSALSTKGQFVAARFAEIGIEVTLPDLDGGDFRNTTLSKQLALVGRLAERLKPTLLIGSSLGGYIAALHAARAPETVARLVLLAPAFNFAERFAAHLGEDGMDRWQREGELSLYHYRDKREVPLGYGFMADAGRHEAFPGVRVPTKVLHGIRDEVVDPQLSERFARNRPNVDVQWLDTDHSMVDVTQEIWESIRGIGFS